MAAGRFLTTRWSLIAAAAGLGADGRAALDELCGIYWEPLYAFVRHDRRRDAADAADLTQAFFADLLARGDIAGVDRERGRFRSWLLQSLRHFLANQTDRDQAEKRGGGSPALSLDAAAAEQRYLREPVGGLDPEKLYMRRWALVTIERALAALRAEYAAGDAKKARELEAVMPALLGEPPAGGYDALAARLGTTPGALRTAAARWRQLLRREVAETMAPGADVDAEITDLMRALS
jgi:RNA polymerase sigma-70 factor (ECF subfamily)